MFEVKNSSPFDTGNLRYNAIRFKDEGRTLVIYVDEAIAPYMPYTNELWISPKWHGKRNPNEGWFDDTAEKLVAALAQRLGGTLRRIG
jgi:hypothetical protein